MTLKVKVTKTALNVGEDNEGEDDEGLENDVRKQ